MFDDVISRSRKGAPSGRTLASVIVSGLAHGLLLLLLVEFPQILQGGRGTPFRVLMGPSDQDRDEREWRTVTILESPARMAMPSAETLERNLPDWDHEGAGAPPIRVRFGDLNAALADLPPMPKAPGEAPKPKVSLPENPVLSGTSEPRIAGENLRATEEDDGRPDADSGRNSDRPPPRKAPAAASAADRAPSRIPDSIPPPTPPRAGKPSEGVFEDETSALESPGVGLFDTKGFPLGNYKDIIVERVKGRWFIPSNLKNSQGQTTIVFYIDKEGRFADARIVASSGNNSLNLAALNAVIESNPFPPLPKGFPGDRIGVKLILIVDP
ncbi:MAG: TonB C-terminal domain-containing protein [Acidobacteria bacterium]|nr:TonB C-terminal domain-containing protein [Acidobacteriota bacterium]